MTGGLIKYLIVDYLRRNDEVTGYRFMRYSRSLGVSTSPGNVYPSLHDLEGEGILTFREVGTRKLYRLTAKGRRLASREMGSDRVPASLRRVLFRMLARLCGSGVTTREDVDGLLAQVDLIRDELKALRERLAQASSTAPAGHDLGD